MSLHSQRTPAFFIAAGVILLLIAPVGYVLASELAPLMALCAFMGIVMIFAGWQLRKSMKLPPALPKQQRRNSALIAIVLVLSFMIWPFLPKGWMVSADRHTPSPFIFGAVVVSGLSLLALAYLKRKEK